MCRWMSLHSHSCFIVKLIRCTATDGNRLMFGRVFVLARVHLCTFYMTHKQSTLLGVSNFIGRWFCVFRDKNHQRISSFCRFASIVALPSFVLCCQTYSLLRATELCLTGCLFACLIIACSCSCMRAALCTCYVTHKQATLLGVFISIWWVGGVDTCLSRQNMITEYRTVRSYWACVVAYCSTIARGVLFKPTDISDACNRFTSSECLLVCW